jgi:hypothetical protein
MGAAILSVCGAFAAGAFAFTPEAESALASLERRVAAGEISEAAYDRFLESLDENSGCESWAGEDDEELAASLREACPEADSSEPGPGRLRLSAAQAVYPRGDKVSAPLLAGAGRASWGAFDASLREGRPYRRLLTAEGSGFTASAGHIFPSLAPTRLDFVAGRRMYGGWTGRSGPEEGPLASDYSALDGLVAAYGARGWRMGAFAAWNRLLSASASAAATEPRRDASTFGLGFSRRSHGLEWRLQAAHERFETGSDSALSVTVAGVQAEGPGSARVGLAVSALNRGSGGPPLPGAFLRAGMGSKGESLASYSWEIWQADGGWANPLSAAPARTRDTLGVTLMLPGRGEGGFSLRSGLALFETGALRGVFDCGGEAGWTAPDPALLGAEGRMSLATSLGPWRHQAGMGWTYRAPGTLHRRQGHAWGQSLAWGGAGWSAVASVWRGGVADYDEASLSLGRKGPGCDWQVEWAADDRPQGNVRLACKQAWRLGNGASLSQTLRMPWTEAGMRSDMNYRLGLEWRGL